VLKSSFLRTLPYIGRDKSYQQFISKLINKIFLTKRDQDELSEYFNIRNKHWSRWSGESNFRIWMLFTSPESCSVFDKKLIDKARMKIIPYMTKFMVGDMVNKIKEYALLNPAFSQLYQKRIAEDTYYQRNFIKQNVFQKMWEKTRIFLCRNKKLGI